MTKRYRSVGDLTVVYLLICFNLVCPVVRLSFQFANYAAFAFAQLIPFRIIHLAGMRSGWHRWRALVIGVLLAPLALSMGCGAAACAALAVPADPSFERRQSVPTDYGVVAVYRTNGGAMTSFGIVVRQECRVLPGLWLVRPIANEYPADEAIVDWQKPGSVRISFKDNREKQPVTHAITFRLRHFCWGNII